jgi:hypothetical protein
MLHTFEKDPIRTLRAAMPPGFVRSAWATLFFGIRWIAAKQQRGRNSGCGER